jgi:DNA polymerase-1
VEDFVVDIETDGLNATIIHLAVVRNVETNNVYVFTDSDHNDFAGLVAGHRLIGHNIISFDLPVLEKLWGYKHDGEVVDTLVLSRLFNPSREGGHSLRAWGETLGFPKGDFNDWSKLTPEMVEYCKQDTAVTAKVYEVLRKEGVGFADTSIDLEHRVAAIIAQQQKNGWLVDQRSAHMLLAKLQEKRYDLEESVRQTFKPIAKMDKEIVLKYKKDGGLSSGNLRWLVDWKEVVWGDFSRIVWQEFNLGSRKQIAERLIALGWKPSKYTEKGSVIVDESVLESVTDIPECKLIAEYFLVQKREAMLSNIIDHIEDDGRVHGYVNSNGAVTGRMTHSDPNMAQIPAGYSPYGKEFRSIFTVDRNMKLVGCDASGLELRMLAHYMNDKDYTHELLTGDIHSANQRAAGLDTRDKAKTFIYAFLYGAGDAKIGSVVGGSARDGAKLKERFLTNTPALAGLRERVAIAAKRGYLKGLDGRKLWLRSEHAALNTLLQSAGAIVMKKALTILHETATLNGIDFKFIGNIHDEFQTEVEWTQAEQFGVLAVDAIKIAGQELGLRCPLDGEYKIGNDWSETH